MTVVCRQLWNQVPVFNHLITLTFWEDSLSAVEGRRLTGEPALDTGQKPISIPTALFQFYHGMVALGDVCSRIESITPGYVTSAGTGALGADSGVVYCHGYPELPAGYLTGS